MRSKLRRTESMITITIILLLLALQFITIQRLQTVSFSTITGEVTSRVYVLELRYAPCNFTLQAGLNLVSFFCIAKGVQKEDVIGNITSLQIMWEYDKENTDSWKIYNPALPSYVIQDMGEMDRVKGYYILTNQTEDVYIDGGLRVPNSIPLSPGWNLAGYPTNRTKSVNESFVSIEGNFSEVRALNSTSQAYIYYISGSSGPLTQTEPYYAYWINSTTNEVWIVD